jgi:hypothetical protein
MVMVLLLLWFLHILFTHFDYILETHLTSSNHFFPHLSQSLTICFFSFLSYVCVWMRVFLLPPMLYLLCCLIKMIGIDPNKDEVILNARTDDITTSYLIIQKADVSDTGKYTCAPSNSAPTSINVHVLHGKRPAGHFL